MKNLTEYNLAGQKINRTRLAITTKTISVAGKNFYPKKDILLNALTNKFLAPNDTEIGDYSAEINNHWSANHRFNC